jgi:glutaredoxin-like protein
MTQQPLIQDQQKSQLKRTLRKDLKAEVGMRLFTQRSSPITIPGRDCKYCAQTQQMLEELAELSPKLRLEIVDIFSQPELAEDEGISRVPALALGAKGKGKLRFFGIPGGHQLSVIVENIKTISRGVSPLSMATRKGLRSINQPVQIQVFVTLTDTQCPPVARLAHALAIENENITADVIEIEEFPALVQQYGIRSVPMTTINELTYISGLKSEQEFVDKVLRCGVRNESKSTNVQTEDNL